MKMRVLSGMLAITITSIYLGGCAATPVEPVAQSRDSDSMASGDALGMQMFAPPAKQTEVTSVDAN